MSKLALLKTIVTGTVLSTLFVTGCASNESAESGEQSGAAIHKSLEETAKQDEHTAESHSGHDMAEHQHSEDGGAPPAGIEPARHASFKVGDEVVVNADHMPGMKGTTATVVGAFDTTTYAVTYTPTDGSPEVREHRWVVHEELENPGDQPLPNGSSVVLTAEHMHGMKGADATIDYSTDEPVYMVDIESEAMTQKNHKWVTESELSARE